MGKYDPLEEHLLGRPDSPWNATFSEVEAVLGFSLPASARDHQAWWANEQSGSHSHARSWIDAGWQTEGLNLAAETIRFRRV